MDSKDIPAKLIELHTAITDKTGHYFSSPTLFISAKDDNAFWSPIHMKGKEHNIRANTADDFFAKAFDIIENLPPEDEQNLAEFQADLAKLIDKGRDYTIDLDFVNPLIDTSKRLAENAITHQVFTADDEVQRAVDKP